MARLAVRELPREPAGTLVTANTRHTLAAGAVATGPVALRGLNPSVITVTCSALSIRVSPVVLLAVCAGAPSKARPTLALAGELITLGADRVVGVTAAGCTPLPTGQVPEVGTAAITALALHIWQTLALPSGSVTDTLILGGTLAAVSAQEVTDAFSAAPPGGVSVEAQLAELTVSSLCVELAFQAQPSPTVTGTRVGHVNVVVALARQTPTASLEWIPVVAGGTLVTA